MSVFDNYLLDNFNVSKDVYSTVFELFDRNKDGFLDEEEFTELLQDLLKNGESLDTAVVTPSLVSCLMSVLDLDKDGKLNLQDFKYAWSYWLRQILKPVKALVIVDVQNDFISGTLSLSQCPSAQDGSAVVPVINKLLDEDIFDLVVYTYDWHPDNHISFIENVKQRKTHSSSKVSVDNCKVGESFVFDMDDCQREQILWPRHCVQKSWGSELHPDLKVVKGGHHITKGMNCDVDSYSAFWDNDKLSQTELSSLLGDKKVTDVYVCGLAYDICAGFTAIDSVQHGFRTVFIEDACRGVSLDGIAKTREDLVAKYIHMTNSDQVPSLARCELRPRCLTVQAAINYNVAWQIIKKKKSADNTATQ